MKLVASKKIEEQILFPTVDYHYETKDSKGDDKKITNTVGFYEIKKKKVVKDNGHKRLLGDVLKTIHINTDDERSHKEIPYEGLTLMMSVRTSDLTTAVREATEVDKEKYKEAYQAHLNHKNHAVKEKGKDEEIAEMKEKLALLEAEQSKNPKGKTKVKDNDATNDSI